MGSRLPWDWFEGEVPDNADLDQNAYLETSFSFLLFRSKVPGAFRMGHGSSAYTGTMFDVGAEGVVSIGDYALLNSVRVICDARVEIGDYALISWNVVLMDSYREPVDPDHRRVYRQDIAGRRTSRVGSHAAPIQIGANVWIGFDSCILPGVTIGAGSIVGARSVVAESVAPYTVVAGNPARAIRTLDGGLRLNALTNPA